MFRYLRICYFLAFVILCYIDITQSAHAQTLYVSNNGAKNIMKFTSSGSGSIFAGTGSGSPVGLVFDKTGNLYVATEIPDNSNPFNPTFNCIILKFTPNGVGSVFADLSGSAHRFADGLAIDNSGNIYVAFYDRFNSAILKFDPAGNGTVFATPNNTIAGLAFDANGNLFVSTYAGPLGGGPGNVVMKITPDGVVSNFASVPSQPRGMSFDSAGNLYCATQADGIVKIAPDGTLLQFNNGVLLVRPAGLTFDDAGNLYATDDAANRIIRYKPDGTNAVFGSGLNQPNYIAFLPGPPPAATSISVPNISGSQGQAVSLSATLKRSDTGAILGGKSLSFKVDGTFVGAGTTNNTTGIASIQYAIPSNLATGNHTITVSFAGDVSFNTSTGTGTLTVTLPPAPTSLVVSNASGPAGAHITLKATLRRTDTNALLSGQSVTYQVNNITVPGTFTTDASGVASAPYTIPVSMIGGSYPISATFAGGTNFLASRGTATLTVTAPTAVSATDASGAPGTNVTLKATLRRTDTNALLSGKPITFKVNNVSVVGSFTTDASGLATASYSIAAGTVPGTLPISVAFAGDGNFLASNGTATLTITAANDHPADTPHPDGSIKIAEVTAYGLAWKTGATWPVAPNPIPIAYVTNAGLLWKSGEVYHYDATASPPWVPGAGRSPHVSGAASLSTKKAKAVGSTAVSSIAVLGSTRTALGRRYQVTLQVKPASASKVYAVEEAVPAGWTVTSTTGGAGVSVRTGKVRWGPFFDGTPRSLSYTLAPPPGGQSQMKITGVVSVDGKDSTITGARSIANP